MSALSELKPHICVGRNTAWRPGYNYTPGRDVWSKALDDQSDPRDVAEYV